MIKKFKNKCDYLIMCYKKFTNIKTRELSPDLVSEVDDQNSTIGFVFKTEESRI